ncbi:MAG TPA: hypothetical protein VIE15_03170 [Acidimicrobiales bacterium]|jgi:predicted lipoprotein with Yx(FWY)xxD motif
MPNTAAQTQPQRSGRPRSRGAWLIGGAVVVALAIIATIVAMSSSSSSAPTQQTKQLQSTAASPYSSVLANSKAYSLYVLSAESTGSLHCTGSCLSFWPPFLVASSTSSVTMGSGVNGTVGFVARSGSMKQVTYNGFPVYRFSGDTGPNQTSGQGIVADGGTWGLASAAATSTGATRITATPTSPPTTPTTYHY